jgi:RNA polymerase sigma factor (sigma-70 family)
LKQFAEDGFDIPDERALVDAIVEDKLLLEILFSALAELTDDERGLIDALFFDEKSERELSKETGVPNQTIHSRKLSVLKKLKKLLEKKL